MSPDLGKTSAQFPIDPRQPWCHCPLESAQEAGKRPHLQGLQWSVSWKICNESCSPTPARASHTPAHQTLFTTCGAHSTGLPTLGGLPPSGSPHYAGPRVWTAHVGSRASRPGTCTLGAPRCNSRQLAHTHGACCERTRCVCVRARTHSHTTHIHTHSHTQHTTLCQLSCCASTESESRGYLKFRIPTSRADWTVARLRSSSRTC